MPGAMSEGALGVWWLGAGRRLAREGDRSSIVSTTRRVFDVTVGRDIDVLDIRAYGPFDHSDPDRGEYIVDLVNETIICPHLFYYVSREMGRRDVLEYRVESGNDDLIVGAAAVSRIERDRVEDFMMGSSELDRAYSYENGGDVDAFEMRVSDAVASWLQATEEDGRGSASVVRAICGIEGIRGVGSELMRHIERMEARHSSVIMLWAVLDAVPFYERIGFTMVHREEFRIGKRRRKPPFMLFMMYKDLRPRKRPRIPTIEIDIE